MFIHTRISNPFILTRTCRSNPSILIHTFSYLHTSSIFILPNLDTVLIHTHPYTLYDELWATVSQLPLVQYTLSCHWDLQCTVSGSLTVLSTCSITLGWYEFIVSISLISYGWKRNYLSGNMKAQFNFLKIAWLWLKPGRAYGEIAIIILLHMFYMEVLQGYS